jgi:hypothetical protein
MHTGYGDVAVTLEDCVATVEIQRPPNKEGLRAVAV